MTAKINRELIYEGKFLRYWKDGRWEYVERTNCSTAAVIVALTEAREIVLVEQHRVPVNASVIELPAGLVGDLADSAEDILDGARRELLEETGYDSDRLWILDQGPVSPGLSNETAAIVVAEGLRKIADGGGDESERIRVHLVPEDEAEQWLAAQKREGKLIDLKVYIGLYAIRNRLH